MPTTSAARPSPRSSRDSDRLRRQGFRGVDKLDKLEVRRGACDGVEPAVCFGDGRWFWPRVGSCRNRRAAWTFPLTFLCLPVASFVLGDRRPRDARGQASDRGASLEEPPLAKVSGSGKDWEEARGCRRGAQASQLRDSAGCSKTAKAMPMSVDTDLAALLLSRTPLDAGICG